MSSSPTRSEDTIDYAGLFNADIDRQLINEVHSITSRVARPTSPSRKSTGSGTVSRVDGGTSGGGDSHLSHTPPPTPPSPLKQPEGLPLASSVSSKPRRTLDPAKIEEKRKRKREQDKAFHDALTKDEHSDFNKRQYLLRKQSRFPDKFSQADQDKLDRLHERVTAARERIKSQRTSQLVETMVPSLDDWDVKTRRRERARAITRALTQQERSIKRNRDRLYKLRKNLRERGEELPDKQQRELNDLRELTRKALRRARQEVEAKQEGAASNINSL